MGFDPATPSPTNDSRMPPAFDFVDDLSRARNVRLEPNVTPHLEVCTTPLLCLVVRHRGTQPT